MIIKEFEDKNLKLELSSYMDTTTEFFKLIKEKSDDSVTFKTDSKEEALKLFDKYLKDYLK